MSKRIKVHFEDHGQDFLWWIVDTGTRKVIECGPHQHDIWTGVCLIDEKVTVGDYLLFYRESVRITRQINYPVARVEVLTHQPSEL